MLFKLDFELKLKLVLLSHFQIAGGLFSTSLQSILSLCLSLSLSFSNLTSSLPLLYMSLLTPHSLDSSYSYCSRSTSEQLLFTGPTYDSSSLLQPSKSSCLASLVAPSSAFNVQCSMREIDLDLYLTSSLSRTSLE